MKISSRIGLGVLLAVAAAFLARLLVGDSLVALLTPHGQVASRERDVIMMSVLVMLGAAVPMLVLLFAFAWRYREGNKNAPYEPDKKPSPAREALMWILPSAIVVALGFIAWTSTHELDPFKPLASDKPGITIQVVALRWKWLFLYPEQGIATVNLVEFPAGVPVHFDLTADGPVSSFWVPQLGSQIYAMAAMRTQLNLMASTPGDYPGRNMEINGEGYADMTFTARAVSPEDFDAWVRQVRSGPDLLDQAAYDRLARPSTAVAPMTYAGADPALFGKVLSKDMMPEPPRPGDAMPGSGMHE